MKTITAVLIAIILIASSVYAQEAIVKLETTGNSNINLTNDTNQQVIRSYTLTGISPEDRANIYAGFKTLLKGDGLAGGQLKIGVQEINGQQVSVLTITATEKMHDSIAQTIEQINKGGFIKWSYRPDTTHYQPRFRSAEQLATILRDKTSGVGLITVDPETNTLSFEEDPTYIAVLQDYVDNYDVPPAQATVEVTIIETKKGVDKNLGIYWDAWKGALPTNVSLSFQGNRGLDGNLEVSSFEGLIENISPQALTQFVNYLSEDGVANVRSQTTLHVVNARPSVFRSGKEVPYQLLAKSGENTELENSVVFDGLEMTVLPTLATELKSLNIKASSTSVVGFAQNNAPLLSTSSVETSIDIDGERTFLLSGLECSRNIQVRRGVPLLKSIPIIKYVFSYERSDEQEWDVKIIVRVTNM